MNMKRKTKRRVGIFLVVAMLAVMIYPAFSTTAEEESAGFIIENGELTAYTGSGGDITIPDTVTGISDNVFSGNTSLTSVTIPGSVISIGSGAFSGCTNLYRAVVPASVVNIGNSVFAGCRSLSDLTFSANVGVIPDMAFYGCASLSSVTIPGTVTSIGTSAFENCTLLGSVTIPAAVDTISDTAFAGCSNLSSVEVDGGNATYSSYDGCIYNKTQTKLLYCPEGKYSVKISDKTSTLSYAALNGCYGITEVTLPASVTVIEQNAFSNSGVQTITIPSSVTDIGSQSSWTPQMIYTYSNSAGEEFAVNNNYTYELLDSPASPADPNGTDDPGVKEDPEPSDGPTPSDPGTTDDPATPADNGTTNASSNNTQGSGTSVTSTSGSVTGRNLAAGGVRSASKFTAKEHVLDSTPKTGPETNAKVILCMAVFFVGVYLIISSRKEEEQTA